MFKTNIVYTNRVYPTNVLEKKKKKNGPGEKIPIKYKNVSFPPVIIPSG